MGFGSGINKCAPAGSFGGKGPSQAREDKRPSKARGIAGVDCGTDRKVGGGGGGGGLGGLARGGDDGGWGGGQELTIREAAIVGAEPPCDRHSLCSTPVYDYKSK